jgi:hypothetical protein
MKQSAMLTTASLLTILFMTMLGGRRAGYIIIFFGSVLGLVMLVLHMKGTRGVIGGDIGNSSQAFLFVWTIPALGITAVRHPVGERTVEFAMAPEPPHVNYRITPVALFFQRSSPINGTATNRQLGFDG